MPEIILSFQRLNFILKTLLVKMTPLLLEIGFLPIPVSTIIQTDSTEMILQRNFQKMVASTAPSTISRLVRASVAWS